MKNFFKKKKEMKNFFKKKKEMKNFLLNIVK